MAKILFSVIVPKLNNTIMNRIVKILIRNTLSQFCIHIKSHRNKKNTKKYICITCFAGFDAFILQTASFLCKSRSYVIDPVWVELMHRNKDLAKQQ